MCEWKNIRERVKKKTKRNHNENPQKKQQTEYNAEVPRPKINTINAIIENQFFFSVSSLVLISMICY